MGIKEIKTEQASFKQITADEGKMLYRIEDTDLQDGFKSIYIPNDFDLNLIIEK